MKRILATATILTALVGTAPCETDAISQAWKIVVQIQRADYEGDRAELKRLYEELAPLVENKTIASRVRYWRGFALWRRTLNGFNDSADPKELARDLELATQEFKDAGAADPGFADAKVGEGSCLSNLMYLNQGNPSRLQELIPQARQVLKEAQAQAPDNPRLAWVLGPNTWYATPQNEENQKKAIDIYQRGLEAIRKQTNVSSDLLEPSWGEPELLMNLAWSNLHRNTADLSAARTYAQSALNLVPYWHYVRDILMPQIENAIDATKIQVPTERDVAVAKAGDSGQMNTKAVVVNLDTANWTYEKGSSDGSEGMMVRSDETTGGMDLLVRLPAGHIVPPHFHDSNERIFVAEGELTLRQDTGDTLLKSGGFAFLPAHQVQRLSCSSKTRCTFYLSWDGKSDSHTVK